MTSGLNCDWNATSYDDYYYNSPPSTNITVSDIPLSQFWNGGILFILLFDAFLFIMGVSIFICVRYASLTHGNLLLEINTSKKKPNYFKQLYARLLHRYSARKREEDHSWFWWIPVTIKISKEKIIEECGKEGFLYLRFQRLLLVVLFVETLVVTPILLFINFEGDSDIQGFGVTTANHIPKGQPIFWVHFLSILLLTVGIFGIIWNMHKTIRQHFIKQITPRLFTIKIQDFPVKVRDESLLFEYFSKICPNQIVQAYICFDLQRITKVYEKLKKTEEKIEHFEIKLTTENDDRPLIHHNKFVRHTCFSKCFKADKDAISHYYDKKTLLLKKLEYLKKKKPNATGTPFPSLPFPFFLFPSLLFPSLPFSSSFPVPFPSSFPVPFPSSFPVPFPSSFPVPFP